MELEGKNANASSASLRSGSSSHPPLQTKTKTESVIPTLFKLYNSECTFRTKLQVYTTKNLVYLYLEFIGIRSVRNGRYYSWEMVPFFFLSAHSFSSFHKVVLFFPASSGPPLQLTLSISSRHASRQRAHHTCADPQRPSLRCNRQTSSTCQTAAPPFLQKTPSLRAAGPRPPPDPLS